MMNLEKKGTFGLYLHAGGKMLSITGTQKFGYLKGRYDAFFRMFKFSSKNYNTGGHDATKEFMLSAVCGAALTLSRLEMDIPDPFVPGLTCGNGKWPSFQLAQFFPTGVMLYGDGYPYTIKFPGLYCSALFYADLSQNGGQYAGKIRNHPDEEAPGRYLSDISAGKIEPFDFTMFVPPGYDDLAGTATPNIIATDDPSLVFSVSFGDGKEVWPEI